MYQHGTRAGPAQFGVEAEGAVTIIQVEGIGVIPIGEDQVNVAIAVDIAKGHTSTVGQPEPVDQGELAIAIVAIDAIGLAAPIGQDPVDIAIIVGIKQGHAIAVGGIAQMAV